MRRRLIGVRELERLSTSVLSDRSTSASWTASPSRHRGNHWRLAVTAGPGRRVLPRVWQRVRPPHGPAPGGSSPSAAELRPRPSRARRAAISAATAPTWCSGSCGKTCSLSAPRPWRNAPATPTARPIAGLRTARRQDAGPLARRRLAGDGARGARGVRSGQRVPLPSRGSPRLRCPIGSHSGGRTRGCSDPRPGTEGSLAVNRRHRLLRRGRIYGPPLATGATDGADRGALLPRAEREHLPAVRVHPTLLGARSPLQRPLRRSRSDRGSLARREHFSVPGNPVASGSPVCRASSPWAGGARLFLHWIPALLSGRASGG